MAAKLPQAGFDALRGGIGRFAALGRGRRVAAGLSAVWVVLVGAYAVGFFGVSQARGMVYLDAAFFLVTLALPLILVWLAAFLAEELARQREMIAALAEVVGPLFGSLEATRTSLDRHGPASPAEIREAVHLAVLAGRGADAVAPFERVLATQAKLAARLDALLDLAAAPPDAAHGPDAARPPPIPHAEPRRPSRPQPTPAATGQPDLPLLPEPAPETPLGWGDLVRALDFPRDAEDDEGFRALRRALRQRNLAKMLQAAEDVMTLLSQEGVYMDDLSVDPAQPESWRSFVAGGRGATVAGMGGVRDEAVLATARGLMKADPIFRDTALFFQRRFDAVLGEVAEGASDADLADLAGTRSGRAFQLMARASGSFD